MACTQTPAPAKSKAGARKWPFHIGRERRTNILRSLLNASRVRPWPATRAVPGLADSLVLSPRGRGAPQGVQLTPQLIWLRQPRTRRRVTVQLDCVAAWATAKLVRPSSCRRTASVLLEPPLLSHELGQVGDLNILALICADPVVDGDNPWNNVDGHQANA